AAEGPMRDIRDRTAITTVLSAPTTSGALVLNTVIGYRTIEIGVRKGSELPFHASAQGKVMLAFGPPALMERTLRLGLPPLTPHTITDADRLAAEIETIRASGVSLAPEEALLGINTLAAPVFDRDRKLVGAVALCGSIQYLPARPGPASPFRPVRTRDCPQWCARWPSASRARSDSNRWPPADGTRPRGATWEVVHDGRSFGFSWRCRAQEPGDRGLGGASDPCGG